MTAIGLIKGSLAADDYEEAAAADPRIDALRSVMVVSENPSFTRDYLDPSKRSIANAVQVFFRGGASTPRAAVDYPVGHRRRRAEGTPLLKSKFEAAVRGHFEGPKASTVIARFSDLPALDGIRVSDLMGLLVP
jgi:2-methylcitrate dehydratase PrpD